MKTLPTVAGVIVPLSLALSAGPGLAQMPPPGTSLPAGTPVSSPSGTSADTTIPAVTAAPEYLRRAGSGDQFEIQSSQLALQMSHDANVRTFAQMLINEHTQLSAAIGKAARSAGVPPPQPALAPAQAEMLAGLRTATASGFDAVYLQDQISAHEQALNLHRGYAAQGDKPALRSAAAQAVPRIEMHLGRARTLYTAAAAGTGSSAGASGAPGSTGGTGTTGTTGATGNEAMTPPSSATTSAPTPPPPSSGTTSAPTDTDRLRAGERG